MRKPKDVTTVEYSAFQQAYDFFNAVLFQASLPYLLIVLHRKAHSRGYFAPKRFSGRIDKSVVHELALNPDCFTGRTDEEILSTLAHEMVHVWQETHGEPSKRTYHNRQWANKMKDIGLYPSHNGEVGGRETGQSMTHYIVKGGPYSVAYAKLKAKGLKLHWQSTPFGANGAKAKTSKNKFTCPGCDMNVWGDSKVEVTCTKCQIPMVAED
jgi:hypothetical protein